MPDLSSTLAAIDAATGCQQCEAPLGGSPSPDFCSDVCQGAYFEARSVPLVGYREPEDLAAHVYNQHEQYSPETTSALAYDYATIFAPGAIDPLSFAWQRWQAEALALALTGNVYYQIGADYRVHVPSLTWSIQDEATGHLLVSLPDTPASVQEAPGVEFDYDFPTTALLAAEEPPPPVMAPVTLDIEAIQRQVDSGGYLTPERIRRSARRINPRGSR